MMYFLKKHEILIKLCLFSSVLKTFDVLFNYIVSRDSVRYVNAAYEFSLGNFKLGLSYAESLPFFPLLLLAFHYVIDNWILSGQILSAILWSLAVIPLYLLTRGLFGEKAALWSGLAFTLSPVFNEYSGDIMREAPFAFFILWAGYYAHRSFQYIRVIDFVAASICVVLAQLFRFEGLVFFLVFPSLILVFIWFDQQSRLAWLRGLAGYVAVPVLLMIGFALAFRGYFAEMRWGAGVIELVDNLFNASPFGLLPDTYEKLSKVESLFTNAQWAHDVIETTKNYILVVYAIGFMDAFVSNLTPLCFLAAAYGIYHGKPGNQRINRCMLVLALAALPAAYYFLVSKNFVSGRYMLASIVLLYPWAGVGVETLCERIKISSRGRWLLPAVLVIFVLLPALMTVRGWSFGSKAHVELARWLNSNPEICGKTITNDERLMLYAGHFRGEYVVYDDNVTGLFESLAKDADVVIIRSSRKEAIADKYDDFSMRASFVDHKSVIRVYMKTGKFSG